MRKYTTYRDFSDTDEIPLLEIVPRRVLITNDSNIIDMLPHELLVKVMVSLLKIKKNWRDIVSFLLVNKTTYQLLDYQYYFDVMIPIQTHRGIYWISFEKIKNVLFANYLLEIKLNQINAHKEELDNLHQSHKTKRNITTCCGTLQCCCLGTLFYGGFATCFLGASAGIGYVIFSLFESSSCSCCLTISTKAHLLGAGFASCGITSLVCIPIFICVNKNCGVGNRIIGSVAEPCCDCAESEEEENETEYQQNNAYDRLENLNKLKSKYDLWNMRTSNIPSFVSANNDLGSRREIMRRSSMHTFFSENNEQRNHAEMEKSIPTILKMRE